MKTYKNIYEFPLRLDKHCDWVYDAKNQFVFQFEIDDTELNLAILDIINGKAEPSMSNSYIHINGQIIESNIDAIIITIRGWGNLTGTGGHHLSEKEAANIQDTFAEFIVERLNSKK